MSKRVFSIVIAALLLLAVCPMATRADVKAGLAGYWPLDGDAIDASGNGNDGTIIGNVSPAPNRYTLADTTLRFPGEAGSYVDLGSPAELRIAREMTITAWVFLNGSNQNDGRIITRQGTAGAESWTLGIEAGADGASLATFQVAGSALDAARVDDTQPLPTDRWVHIVGIYRPSQALEIYIDGQMRAVTNAGIPDTPFTDAEMTVRIGSANGCSNCGWDGLIDEVRIYDRTVNQVEIWQIMRAEVGLSSAPQPPDGATDVPADVTLSWTAGQFARSHDLYFGAVRSDVNNASRANPRGVLLSQGRSVATYAPNGNLDLGQTYYWRVDEVNSFDSIIYKGNVWSFTVEPYATIIANVVATSNAIPEAGQGPNKTIDGSGLNGDDEHSTEPTDMWLAAPSGDDPVWLQYRFETACRVHQMLIWNYNEPSESSLGSGLKDVTVEYSTDGAAWSTLKDVELARATGTADYAPNTTVALGGIVARYVRLIIHSTWGMTGRYGLSEVRFSQVPIRARAPKPANGETGVDVDLILRWSAGREAAVHDVHFNSSAPMVATGAALLDSVVVNEYPVGALTFGTPYYWRIDERNDARNPSVWQGEIWTFTTRQYATIDGFESYTDESGRRIYEIWRDGYDNGTGSLVGYMEAPFAEKSIVHSGGQSMPLTYNNGDAPFYSEAVRPMAMEQNWQGHGADALRLFVRGQPGNAPGSLYIAIEDKIGRLAVVTHSDPAVLTKPAWQEWVIPYSAFDGVSLSGVMAIYLGVGNRDNPTPGGSGLIYVDDLEYGHPTAGPPPARR